MHVRKGPNVSRSGVESDVSGHTPPGGSAGAVEIQQSRVALIGSRWLGELDLTAIAHAARTRHVAAHPGHLCLDAHCRTALT